MSSNYQKIYDIFIELIAEDGKALKDSKAKERKKTSHYGFHPYRMQTYEPLNRFTYDELEVLIRKKLNNWEDEPTAYREGPLKDLDDHEEELLLEVFWDVFKEGKITIGWNREKPTFPYFRISTNNKQGS